MDYYLSSAYLAPVEYYTKLYDGDRIFIERYDHYIKQTYRNRCMIAGPNGPLSLTIPTEKSAHEHCCMKDVRISDHGKWQHVHWQALVSAYYTSPFFEYYQDDFRPFYEKSYTYLYDFNEELQILVCKLLDLQPEIQPTKCYKTDFKEESELDLRDLIRPKHGFDWDMAFKPKVYYQVFKEKNGFLPNLSIVDLLFNMGPEGLLVLRDSILR